MSLYSEYQRLLEQGWQGVFAQRRTHRRAIQHALAWPSLLGRRTISRLICALGRQLVDWSADYRLFSRSPWNPDRLFRPVVQEFLARYPRGPVPVALDDTSLRKTGKHIPHTGWQYDHMSPPFHANLLYGLRFLSAGLLFPHYREGDYSARSFPVRFRLAPFLKRPGKRASSRQRRQYERNKKLLNLSTRALALIGDLRRALDREGAHGRTLLVVGDGSFCNQTLFRPLLKGVRLIARCRKDARLCRAASADSRRFYSAHKFTPEQVRQDGRYRWSSTVVYYGGRRRRIRFKQIKPLYWQRGANRRPLRLIVIAPQPYRLSPNARTLYRQPAYLLTTDLRTSATCLIQSYLDRWQIEVNHRDQKQLLGAGQAQVWNPLSVPRHPAFVVACHSLLLLAALRCFGPGRNDAFLPLPRWRKNTKRPSLLDLIALLRCQINEASNSSSNIPPISQNSLAYAYT